MLNLKCLLFMDVGNVPQICGCSKLRPSEKIRVDDIIFGVISTQKVFKNMMKSSKKEIWMENKRGPKEPWCTLEFRGQQRKKKMANMNEEKQLLRQNETLVREITQNLHGENSIRKN